MRSTTLSMAGELRYLSHAAERYGEERGREFFRVDVYPDGCRTIAAHAEIDDEPAVVRDVNLRLDSRGLPADCFVRIAVGGNFRGSGWFLFSEGEAECQAMTVAEGRVSQVLQQSCPLPAFGNHAIVNDGYLMSLYDLSAGPGTQVVEKMLLSSPDHRGATGPMMFITDVTIQFHGRESIEVEAGRFNALKYSIIDVPGLPLEHPPYNLWCTDDGNFILLKADVGGYMKTAYELVNLQKTTAGAD